MNRKELRRVLDAARKIDDTSTGLLRLDPAPGGINVIPYNSGYNWQGSFFVPTAGEPPLPVPVNVVGAGFRNAVKTLKADHISLTHEEDSIVLVGGGMRCSSPVIEAEPVAAPRPYGKPIVRFPAGLLRPVVEMAVKMKLETLMEPIQIDVETGEVAAMVTDSVRLLAQEMESDVICPAPVSYCLPAAPLMALHLAARLHGMLTLEVGGGLFHLATPNDSVWGRETGRSHIPWRTIVPKNAAHEVRFEDRKALTRTLKSVSSVLVKGTQADRDKSRSDRYDQWAVTVGDAGPEGVQIAAKSRVTQAEAVGVLAGRFDRECPKHFMNPTYLIEAAEILPGDGGFSYRFTNKNLAAIYQQAPRPGVTVTYLQMPLNLGTGE